ncbi:DUF4148 domain-containing protein [Oxalobacteraceae bacterium A2-2]
MKTIQTLIASAAMLLAAGAALAEPVKTRAEVQAEVQQARAAGALDQTEATLNPPVVQTAGLTRAQVRAEVVAARAAGTLDTSEADYVTGWNRAKAAKVDAQLAAKSGAAQQH